MIPSDFQYTCGDHFGCRDDTKQHPTANHIVILFGHIGGHATDIAFSLKFKQELQHL